MSTNFKLAALGAAVLLAACGNANQDTAAPARSASASAAASSALNPDGTQKAGTVIVAPISKIASAPGVDPMDPKTLPPMPAFMAASAAAPR